MDIDFLGQQISRELDNIKETFRNLCDIECSQDVVVVVTIKDPRHRGTIYTECLDLLEQRGYVHNDINIHNDIRVDN